VQLLSLLARRSIHLTKVTLNTTWLYQNDLEELAKLPMLHYLKLRHKAYNDSELTFKKDEFNCLKYFLVEGSNMTHIIFDDGATPNLEKMLLPFNGDLKVSGVENLPKLGELELKNTTTTTTFTTTPTTTNNTNTTTTTTTTITTTGACVQWVSGRSTQDNVKHASGSDKHTRRMDRWLGRSAATGTRSDRTAGRWWSARWRPALHE